ncbi:hypothetical protein LINPERPRIM_LOCUS25412 [Linum perenne]
MHQHAMKVLSLYELYMRDWNVVICHIYQERNKVDYLVSGGDEFPIGCYHLSNCNLGHILRYDCLGISESRD